MKKYIIKFAYWLLEVMGANATKNEVNITLTVTDEATSTIDAIKKKLEDLHNYNTAEDVVRQQLSNWKEETCPGTEPAVPNPDTVDCEVCGCMVNKTKAIKGAGIIKDNSRRGEPYMRPVYVAMGLAPMNAQYIYYPHYCKAHAPKKKKK